MLLIMATHIKGQFVVMVTLSFMLPKNFKLYLTMECSLVAYAHDWQAKGLGIHAGYWCSLKNIFYQRHNI